MPWLSRPEAVPAVALGALFAGVAVRLWFSTHLHAPADFLHSDMGVYDMRAHHLLDGQLGPWDTFTPVGYPAFLALHYWLGIGVAGVGLTQSLLGGVTCAVTALIAARLVPRPLRHPSEPASAALLAGGACVLYLPFLFYDSLLLSESLFTAGVTVSCWLLLRVIERSTPLWIALAGICLAASAVVRPNLMLVYPLLLPWLWLAFGRETRKTAAVWIGLLLAGVPLLLGVGVHNSRLLGHSTGLASNGGLNFFLARAQVASATFQEGTFTHRIMPVPNMLRYQGAFAASAPFYDEAYFYKEGVAVAAQDPFTWVRSLANLWEGTGLGMQGFWPGFGEHELGLRVSGVLGTLLTLPPALFWLGLMIRRRQLLTRDQAPRLLVVLLFSTVLLTLYLMLGDPRIRVPFDGVAIALAAGLWLEAWRWRRRRARAQRGSWPASVEPSAASTTSGAKVRVAVIVRSGVPSGNGVA